MSETKSLAIIPRSVDEARSLAELISKSSLISPDLRSKPADVFVQILAGQELGLSPMAAIRGVHIVQGKPVLSADTMVGVALGSGQAQYFSCVAETDTSVTYETQRKGSPAPQRCTWSMEDAKRAGLGGNNWAKYPRAMLKARCKAMLARDVYPDVLAGCYDPDELADVVVATPRPREPIQDAEVVDTSDQLLADIVDAKSEAALSALLPRLKAVPKEGEPYTRLKAAYAEQLEILRTASRDEGGEP